jgi:hypothetical protein
MLWLRKMGFVRKITALQNLVVKYLQFHGGDFATPHFNMRRR